MVNHVSCCRPFAPVIFTRIVTEGIYGISLRSLPHGSYALYLAASVFYLHTTGVPAGHGGPHRPYLRPFIKDRHGNISRIKPMRFDKVHVSSLHTLAGFTAKAAYAI